MHGTPNPIPLIILITPYICMLPLLSLFLCPALRTQLSPALKYQNPLTGAWRFVWSALRVHGVFGCPGGPKKSKNQKMRFKAKLDTFGCVHMVPTLGEVEFSLISRFWVFQKF